tara:strand:- start:1684 stop:2151 length:468 start_codon:yes stop_codon:yes gene_type:complete
MATTYSNQNVRLTADYVMSTAVVQFSSKAKMTVTYRDGKDPFEGTFAEWIASPKDRDRFEQLSSVTVGRKAKKIQFFCTPEAGSPEEAWLIANTEGLNFKFPAGCTQQVNSRDARKFARTFRAMFKDTKALSFGLVDFVPRKENEKPEDAFAPNE